MCDNVTQVLNEALANQLHLIAVTATETKIMGPASVARDKFINDVNEEVRRLRQCAERANRVVPLATDATETQRKKRDGEMKFETILGKGKDGSKATKGVCEEKDSDDYDYGEIDKYIEMMEKHQLGFEMLKHQPLRPVQSFPREIRMCLKQNVPQIHKEYPKLRGWPVGVNTTFAYKVLYKAYLTAQSHPWDTAFWIRGGGGQPDKSVMLKRWHGVRGVMKVLSMKKDMPLELGQVIDGRRGWGEFPSASPSYDTRIRSNFVNNPNKADKMFIGETHIAIGFNDLSCLLSANIIPAPARMKESIEEEVLSVESSEPPPLKPLRFVGFEMSEFSVAKYKIIAFMLSIPSIPVSTILEVWFSSTWSINTLRSFRLTAESVRRDALSSPTDAKVMSYINHWCCAEPVSAAEARQLYFSNLERYASNALMGICSFVRLIDRLALCHYLLTGEVSLSAEAAEVVRRRRQRRRHKRDTENESEETKGQVGSLCMWSCPVGSPPLEADVAFNCVAFMTLLDEYALNPNLSIMDLFTIRICEDMSRIRVMMMNKLLTIDLHQGVVKIVNSGGVEDLNNEALIKNIASMRPRTISWSNCIDYFLPEYFHDVARRCSVHGNCTHYGYSMNWLTMIYGCWIGDYDRDVKRDKKIADDVLDVSLGFKKPPDRIQKNRLSKRVDDLLVDPLYDTPYNLTALHLAHQHHSKWVDYFFDAATLSLDGSLTSLNRDLIRGDVYISDFAFPLHRTTTSVYITWRYDAEMEEM
eukprot:GHVN01057887.1.p1 GENE.GHVN01057887.1~~GHVN01057887.1.p1  ORF type:complete len:756 (-),score=125.67 GHVN01057887.1:119-2386(-)